jgi:hypothetical protein
MDTETHAEKSFVERPAVPNPWPAWECSGASSLIVTLIFSVVLENVKQRSRRVHRDYRGVPDRSRSSEAIAGRFEVLMWVGDLSLL